MSEIELPAKMAAAAAAAANSHAGPFDDSEDSDSDDSEGLSLLRQSFDDENLETGVGGGPFFQPSSRPTPSVFGQLWHRPWLGPDNNEEGCAIGTMTLLDAPGLRLLRFSIVTVVCLLAVHGYAHIAGDKRDVTYDLQAMVVYDGKPIATDIVVFFLVGRLYKPDAVRCDTLAFVVPLLGTAILQSWGATHLSSLQHSITPYELKCEWTWQMYLLVLGGCGSLLGSLLVAHGKEVRKRDIGMRSLVEFVATMCVFVLPYLWIEDRGFFHVHHWYYAWILGMHCNLHGCRWSELAMAVLWGIYINGVAIFGRDPVLTCSVTLYQSQNQECPYLDLPSKGYDQYRLADLARDSGFHATDEEGGDSIVCPSDVTRWLFGK